VSGAGASLTTHDSSRALPADQSAAPPHWARTGRNRSQWRTPEWKAVWPTMTIGWRWAAV